MVEDDSITLQTEDSGDIGRVFRLLGYDLPIESGTRITHVFVTIHKQVLTERNSHAKITSRGDDPASEPEPELPF